MTDRRFNELVGECPITHVPYTELVNPVILNGITYERDALIEWVRRNGTDPSTRQPVRDIAKEIQPNRALINLIEAFRNAEKSDVDVMDTDDSESDIIATLAANVLTIRSRSEKRMVSVDIVCVIDASGSMNSTLNVKTKQGSEESNGYTILDLVKHSVKTVAYSLGNSSRLGIVRFSSAAKVALPLTFMDKIGHTAVDDILLDMYADGNTNLWAGIQLGLDQLQSSEKQAAVVMVFTDGEPNLDPPLPYDEMLTKYRSERAKMPIVNVFGFGSDLDSGLLVKIAEHGGGSFAHIFDSSMIGTVFVNALANARTIACRDIKLSYPTSDELFERFMVHSIYDKFPGEYPLLTGKETVIVLLGALYLQQARDIEIKHGFADGMRLFVGDVEIPVVRVTVSKCDFGAFVARRNLVTILKKTIDLMKDLYFTEAKGVILNLIRENTLLETAHPGFIDAIKIDLTDQVLVALNDITQYEKWGQHYIRALMHAHIYQICSNFKDKSVQFYATEVFRIAQSDANYVFGTIDPPKPSGYISEDCVIIQNSQQLSQTYNDPDNPCLSGDTYVYTNNGQTTIADIRKGDMIQINKYLCDEVLCVVKTVQSKIIGVNTTFVRVSDSAYVTPWHPISVADKWVFPVEYFGDESIVERHVDAVYSLVLESADQFAIGKDRKYSAICMAHNVTNGIAAHDYFGTGWVLYDLKNMRGWKNGLVELCGVKRGEDGKVCGLIEI
ncbi:MAG TPA: VWA domain-containing protein [Candidatus Paceibacterota bacterium]